MGTVGYSDALESNNEYLSGTVATYTCNNGFELFGDVTRTCQNDGTWTGSEPTSCQSMLECPTPSYVFTPPSHVFTPPSHVCSDHKLCFICLHAFMYFIQCILASPSVTVLCIELSHKCFKSMQHIVVLCKIIITEILPAYIFNLAGKLSGKYLC